MVDDMITNEDLEEMEEEQAEEKKESEQELMEDLREEDAESYGVPEQARTFERFKFLTEVRDLPDTIRTSYLTKSELGFPLFSVRFWLNLKLLADLKEYNYLGDYLHNKALVTTHTGLSREGFLLNTAITKRKESKKHKLKPQEDDKSGK